MIKRFKSIFYCNILKSWLIAGSWLVVLFCVVFYGIDHLTAQREDLYHLYFQWEIAIPFVPFMYVFYISVLLLPFILPFKVSSPDQVKRWAIQMSLVIIIGGCFFLLFPATLGYSDSRASALENLEIIQMIAGTYNLVPSLHVALSLVTMSIIWVELEASEKVIMAVWTLLMTLSTLLTHQHHILDVVSGFLLAWIVSYSCQRGKKDQEEL
jgi:membrane-associated phospholipid phosphatase